MIRYRAFRNSDPPLLAEIWRSRNANRGLMQPMSADIFEQFVLAKPYFDRHGLIVATEDERPVGFVHAGFGPTDDGRDLGHEHGVTSMLLVHPHPHAGQVASQLLARSENYLRERGAKVLFAGETSRINPFYLGLYGGSEMPGVLTSDGAVRDLCLEFGYKEVDRTLVFHRDLTLFRPIVDRHQMQIRRRMQVETFADPRPSSWWEACTYGRFDRTLFELGSRNAPPAARLMTWNLEPMATTWGLRAAGVSTLAVEPDQRRQGLATYLLGEAFRQLQAEGTTLVEAQTNQASEAAAALYRKLGFRQVDEGIIFRKNLD